MKVNVFAVPFQANPSVPGESPSAVSSRVISDWMLEKLRSAVSTAPSPLLSGRIRSPLTNSGSRIRSLNAVPYARTSPSVLPVNGICVWRMELPASPLKAFATACSIERISFGPMFVKLRRSSKPTYCTS